MRATVHAGFFVDPPLVAARFITTEVDYGRSAEQVFNAGAPVVDLEAVRMQMLFLHGQAKITRSDDA